MPADVETVCAFLESQAKFLCPSSVRRRLYAIRKLHRLLRLPDPTWDEDVNITLRRVRRAKLNRPKQAKGMTREYLERCIAVQPDDPWGLRNRAMISLGYDLLRVSRDRGQRFHGKPGTYFTRSRALISRDHGQAWPTNCSYSAS